MIDYLKPKVKEIGFFSGLDEDLCEKLVEVGNLVTKKKGEYISDREILTILQNMVKQRKESVSIYSKAGRQDLKKREEKEIEIINSFLPTQIKSNDLEIIIEETIKELDCQSLKDLGKVISNLKEKYPGQMDMREVADLAKKKLK